jgi:hypothetical protein
MTLKIKLLKSPDQNKSSKASLANDLTLKDHKAMRIKGSLANRVSNTIHSSPKIVEEDLDRGNGGTTSRRTTPQTLHLAWPTHQWPWTLIDPDPSP